MPRVRFKLDPTAPKPYDPQELQKLMRADAKRLTRQIATALLGSPWLDLLFTGGTFQVFLGKKKPSWLSGESIGQVFPKV